MQLEFPPTRSALGAPAGPASGPAAAAAIVAGGHGPADADRGGGPRRRARPLPGHRRLPEGGRTAAVGPGHGRSGGLAARRGRSAGAGPFAADERARDGTGRRLAAGGAGAAVRLRAGGAGAAVRPQRELGFAAAGIGGPAAGDGAAAGAGWRDRGARSDEVPGADGARQRRGLPADGGVAGGATLQQPPGRPVVCGLARGVARSPPADSGGAAVVSESAATAAGAGIGRAAARSGDGGGDRPPGQPPAGRRRPADGWQRARPGAAPGGSRAGTAPPAGRKNFPGASAC